MSGADTLARAIRPSSRRDDSSPGEEAMREAAQIVQRHGLELPDDSEYLRDIAEVLTAFRRLGQGDLTGIVDGYLEAAKQVAELDVATIADRPDRYSLVEAMVIGTVLGDTLFSALRALAHVDASERHLMDANPRPATAPADDGA